MAILVPIDSRLTGTWTLNGGATAHAILSDGSEATDVQTEEVNTARMVLHFGDGGYPEEGNWTWNARVEHNGNPNQSTEATVVIYDGDPDAGGHAALNLFNSVGIPRNTQTASRTLTNPQQRQLGNVADIWVEILIERNDRGVTFYWVELEVPDDPVGTWNSDLSACPLDTLVWFQMSDGRARQGRRLTGGEYDDGSGGAIELDQSSFSQDPDGKTPASRCVIGWGSI